MTRYCVICGHELITEDNQMLSDVLGVELDTSEDAMVTYAHCPECGCDYEMTDASNKDILEDSTYIGEMKIWQQQSNEENHEE